MAEPRRDIDYPVRVIERRGGYDLRIPELYLLVRGADLRQAYDELIKRKRELFDAAQANEASEELPQPDPSVIFASVSQSNLAHLTALCSDLFEA